MASVSNFSDDGKPDHDPTPRVIALSIIAMWIALALVACALFFLWPTEADAAKRPGRAPTACVIVVTDVVALDEGAYRAALNGVPHIVAPRTARHTALPEGRYTCTAFKQLYRIIS